KRLLERCELLRVGQAFDGLDAATVGLHGEHEAAAHDLAVDAHGARTTDAVLTADVRAGEAQLVTQEVDQMHARCNPARYLDAIDRQCGFDSAFHPRDRSTFAKCSLVAGGW